MIKVLENVSLREKNSYHIGGNAAFYAEPSTENEIIEVLSWASQNSLPVFILGKGTNLLISDNGWPGLVINISQLYHGIVWENNRAVAQSGAMLNTLVNQAIQHSLAGAEELIGIPGTVGGGVIMNAGAFSMCIAEIVEQVTFYDFQSGAVQSFNRDEMCFGYRTSSLQNKPVVILSVVFRFEKAGSLEDLAAVKNTILKKRKEKQPLDFPNCGSVFKRPPENFAGTLIEKCGFKGYRIGGAEVSEKHANFIINRENGTARDVRKLIVSIQKRVFGQTGILLEPEVLFVGEFDEPLYEPGERKEADVNQS